MTHVQLSGRDWSERLTTTTSGGLRFIGDGSGSGSGSGSSRNGSLRGSKTMSGCAYEPKVSAFYDGELPEPERAAFEAHLAGCAICTAELERVQSLSDELRAAPQPHLTEMDKARLRQSAAAEARRLAKGDGRWARWLTAAAAAVFLVSVSQIYFSHRNPGNQPGVLPALTTQPDERDSSHTDGKHPTAPSSGREPIRDNVNPGT